MATVIEALGAYLETNGQGVAGTNLFIGRMPSDPDVCICLYEYEGQAPLEHFGSQPFSLELPRLQVVTRATREDYLTARDKAVSVRSMLASIVEQTISGKRILRVQSLGSVVPLGFDTNDRPKFAINFQVTAEA